jgi:hypothetical protein
MVAALRFARLRWLVIALFVFHQCGCGTIFFPERKGQPPGPLDLKVVALDAIGLLFFFIPGVIAFAVDFNNGTIYLPPGTYSQTGNDKERWKGIRTTSTRPDSAEIEEAIRTRTGKSIRLKPGSYRVARLDSMESLEDLNLDDRELSVACEATDVRFHRQSE